jgi:hypothetical protein
MDVPLHFCDLYAETKINVCLFFCWKGEVGRVGRADFILPLFFLIFFSLLKIENESYIIESFQVN